MWTINKQQDKQQHVHFGKATTGNPTIAKRIKFFQAFLFSPTLATLANTIDIGYLITFPAFTVKQLNKYPPSLIATHKYHLKAVHQGLRSTKIHSLANLKHLRTTTITHLPKLIECN